jgi:chitosanase
MKLVSSAENSSLDWKAQYKYIEDIGDGRGYTAGIIGFCSGTGDMLELVELYTERASPATSSPSTCPRCATSTAPTRTPASTRTSPGTGRPPPPTGVPAGPERRARPRLLQPRRQQGKADGLRRAGPVHLLRRHRHARPRRRQRTSFGGIRKTAMRRPRPRRRAATRRPTSTPSSTPAWRRCSTEEAHSDTSRVDTEQRVFLNAGNFDLNPPLTWKVYGDAPPRSARVPRRRVPGRAGPCAGRGRLRTVRAPRRGRRRSRRRPGGRRRRPPSPRRGPGAASWPGPRRAGRVGGIRRGGGRRGGSRRPSSPRFPGRC